MANSTNQPSPANTWIVRHQLPGRLRLYNPALRNNDLLAAAVSEVVFNEIGVTIVHANPGTGTVLIHFAEGAQTRDSLLHAVHSAAMIHDEIGSSAGAIAARQHTGEIQLIEEEIEGVVVKVARALRHGAVSADANLKSVSGGRVNLRQMVLGLLAGRVFFIMAQTGAASWVSVESLVEWLLAFTLYQNPRAEAEYRIAKSYAFAGP